MGSIFVTILLVAGGMLYIQADSMHAAHTLNEIMTKKAHAQTPSESKSENWGCIGAFILVVAIVLAMLGYAKP